MIEAYYIGFVGTAGYMFLLNRPRHPGDWLAFTALSFCWPLVFGFAAYCAIRKARGLSAVSEQEE